MTRNRVLSAFLINARKRANLSQKIAAERCSLVTSQKMVSRIEAAPYDFSLDVLTDFVMAIGANKTEFGRLVTAPIKLLDRGNLKVNNDLKLESQALQTSIDSIITQLNTLDANVRPNELLDKMKAARNDISTTFDSGILAVMGPSDSGKSHLINLLMCQEIAPEGFQPMTAASTLFIHKDKKPSYLANKDNVIVFKFMNENEETFNLSRLEGDHDSFVIGKGTYKILEKYGARDENDEILYPETYLAVVYVDAPVLKRISLLDTPGQLIDPEYKKDNSQTIDSLDVRKAYEAMGLADAILFTSSMTKFLRDGEPEFYSKILRAPGNVPLDSQSPIKNITILATQAFGVKSIDEFNRKTAKRAAISFNKEMEHLLYESWQTEVEELVLPKAEDWAERMLPFWDDNTEFMAAFTSRFDELVENTTTTLAQRRLNRLRILKRQLVLFVDQELIKLQAKLCTNEERIKEVKEQDARFHREVTGVLEKFHQLRASIKDYEADVLSQADIILQSLQSEDFIMGFIEDRFDDKDSAKKGISDAIGQYLETKMKRIVGISSKSFAQKVEVLVNEFSALVPSGIAQLEGINLNDFNQKSITAVGFDGQSAFIGGLSGIASFGAMGAYVATISSNLGAYLLVGKAAGVLTTLGITGSVSTLPWLVGLTGGPVVWGAMIAAGVGFLVYKLFSNWKKSMAKSTVKGIKESNIEQEVKDQLKHYWSDTAKGFDAALNGLKTEASKHIESLYADAEKTYDATEITQAIDSIKTVQSIING